MAVGSDLAVTGYCTTDFTTAGLVKLLDEAPAETAAHYARNVGEVIAETHTLRLLNLRRVTRAIAG